MNLRPFVCSVLASAFLLPMHAMGESEARDPLGRTPLMKLVWREDATVQQVQQLLDAGADINARDNAGNTVLMRACRVWWYCHEVPGDMDVVRFLVEKGVDVHDRNAAGQNALEVAMCSHESDEEVLAYLRELGLTHQLGAELAMAAGQDCPDDVKRLLAAGAAFLGTHFGIKIMRAMATNIGYGIFAFYSVGLAMMAFVLYLSAV